MKKFLTLVALTLSLPAFAGNWQIQSMLNPNIAALIITNNLGGFTGWTNLAYLQQNAIQGTTSGGAVIATNVNQCMLTNKYGQLVILTNGVLPTTVNLPGANIIYETTTTNGFYSSMNPFQDAYFNSDLNSSFIPFQVTQGGSSNIVQTAYTLGLLSVIVQPNGFYPTGGTGTITNNVQMFLEGIPFGPLPPQTYPYLGLLPALGSQDLISSTRMSVTFTNLPGIGAAGNQNMISVYQVPITTTNFPGMRGFRVRSVNCSGTGVATNQLAVLGILFTDFAP